MKKFLLLLIALTSSANLISQSWSPLSTGLSGGGTLGNCFTIYNNKLIVGGAFETAGGNISKGVASWDGSNWSAMNTGIDWTGQTVFTSVRSLAVFNNTLFAGGFFNSAGVTPLNSLAKWNGSSWLPVTLNMHAPASNNGMGIYSLFVFNNALYVAGLFDSIGGIAANNIAKYDGINWTALGNGITYPNSISYPNNSDCNIRSLYSYNNELIVGGYFNQAGTIAANNIAKWNGTTWSTLGVGFPSSFSSGLYKICVTSLGVYNSELYAGNSMTGISKWNGTNWSAVGGGIPNGGNGNLVTAMCVYNNKLILAGNFLKAGNLDLGNIAAWDGANWYYVGGNGFGLQLNGLQSLGGGAGGILNLSNIRGLIVYNSDLYATGTIWTTYPIQIPIITFNNICKFSGAISIGVKENSPSYLSTISPNPSKGEYTFEGLSEKYNIDIFDVTGRIIYSNYIDQNNNTVNLTGKYPGVYIYKILNKENVIKQGKLILE